MLLASLSNVQLLLRSLKWKLTKIQRPSTYHAIEVTFINFNASAKRYRKESVFWNAVNKHDPLLYDVLFCVVKTEFKIHCSC